MTSLGICINPENILVTTGSQQALSLVVQALLRSDDMVIVEQPTYNGALDLFEALHIRPYLRKTIRIYKKRREAMVAAVDRYLNGCVAYSVPQGGLFLWLRLIGQVDGGALIRQAVDAGVGFAPGAGFFIDKSAGEQFLRLNYAYQTEASIDKGIRRLAEALARLN